MPTGTIIPVKYVFLDVVAYTKGTIEAQCYIIEALNRIVKGAINRYHISDGSVIYIPTGDGMCIALLGIGLQYDVHMTVAKEILRRVWVNNSRVKQDWRKFEVRVGINQGDDNVVTDINNRENVAGAGINNARRIMDLADARQILVSSTVYENLHPRKEYYQAFSQEFRKEVKHGLVLKMHQLVRPDANWLNVNPPSSLVSSPRPPEPEPKLTKLLAYYFAHLIKNEDLILDKVRENILCEEPLQLLLWFLAKDSEQRASKSPYDIYATNFMPDGCPDTMEKQIEWFCKNIPYKIALKLYRLTLDDAVPSQMKSGYFEGAAKCLVISSKGKEKLKRDWPEIWNEFRRGELSG